MANPNPSPATRFKAGASGNAGGMTAEQKAARDLLNTELDSDEMRDAFVKGYKAQLEKGNALILVDYANRKLGKPVERVEASFSSENPAEPLTTEALLELATKLQPKPST